MSADPAARAIEEGRAARREGLPLSANPHRGGSEKLADAWEDGWRAEAEPVRGQPR